MVNFPIICKAYQDMTQKSIYLRKYLMDQILKLLTWIHP